MNCPAHVELIVQVPKGYCDHYSSNTQIEISFGLVVFRGMFA